jgi:hypothetical protein
MVWEHEHECERLARELRHQQGIKEDMQNEIAIMRQKREEIDNMLQDAKTTICQQMIQMRQMQSTNDS